VIAGVTRPYARLLTTNIVGLVSLLGAVLLGVIFWQGIDNTREIARQDINAALNNVVKETQALLLAAEITATSTERIVRTVRPGGATQLRFTLESALAGFEQHAELSHLGVILPDTGEYGNLERSEDGSILLWLYPGARYHDVTRSFLLTRTGFIPWASYQGTGYDLRIRPVYQAAVQASEKGAWIPTHPWILHGDQYTPLWGFSYVKALYDEEQRLLAVLDANFDMSALRAYLRNLEHTYGVQLHIIELGATHRLIGGDEVDRVPHALPETFQTLLTKLDPADGTIPTDTLSLNQERHWVAAQPLHLKGNVSWLIVASRPAPWLDASLRDLLYQVLGMGLVIIAVLVLVALRIAHRATHDDMTGLPNRILVTRRIRQAMKQASLANGTFAVLHLNLDRFKTVNDRYGHRFGNAVLKAVGEKLTDLLRPGDTVGHLSGDRFFILLPGLQHANDAQRLARTIMAGLTQSLWVQEREVHLSVSIGISLFPEHGKTADALISSADIAMYYAKRMGSGTFQILTPAMNQETQRRIELEVQLRGAEASGQLYLLYQPKVSLQTRKITGCEALVRWRHPELGEISPAQFIPVAEESGLIMPIGDWVLQSACTQAKAWLDAGLSPISVAVNLSARQFLQQDVVAWVRATLHRTQLPAHCLELEFTESLPPQNMEQVVDTLNQLHALGIRLSIDDFGTGYSNLSYLKRFRMDTLKIDQVFMRNALTQVEDAAIVRTIITMARSLNVKVLAEGVETEAHIAFLRKEQCDEMQGYYFSRPLSSEQFEAMLRTDTRLAA